MALKINVNGVDRGADVDGDTPLARLRRAHSTHYETALAIFSVGALLGLQRKHVELPRSVVDEEARTD
jgi:hypothetical protein